MNRKLGVLISVVALLYAWTAFAQRNFGLVERQDSSMLPYSKGPAPVAVRKTPQQSGPVLVELGRDRWRIDSSWKMVEADRLPVSEHSIFSPEFDASQWYDAVVPGTVLTTLVEQGVYPDPYYGLNNMLIPDSLCRTDWWYRVSFERPETENGHFQLRLNGINYAADVWLNGVKLGEMKGAFCRGIYDITDYIKEENTLAVHIYPPHNPGIPHEQSKAAGIGPNGGLLCLDGPTFISSEGWDWIPGIRDRNIGIWQDVELLATGGVTLGDVHIIPDLPLPDVSYADLTIKGSVSNKFPVQQTVTLRGKIEGIVFEKQLELAAGSSLEYCFMAEEFPQLRMENPRLWWPNGYGEQDMYNMELSVVNDVRRSDGREIRFGIRELSYELSVAHEGEIMRVEFMPTDDLHGKGLFDNIKRVDVDKQVCIPSLRDGVSPADLRRIAEDGMDNYLVIKVNGVRIFCRGGNWGMDDGMKRVSRERLEPYFALHKNANFNMIRNWTGESTEEVFYELCDEYGMLVWNDFWWSTEGYNLNPADETLFMENATDAVRRFRNHPSIAVWGPRNEGYASKTMEPKLTDMIAQEDGTRLYHGNSRYLNLRPSGPWRYCPDLSVYFSKDAKGFNTELGTPSVPTAASMRRMMPEEDLWPIGDAWYYHDFHNGQKEYCTAIDRLYGHPDSLDDFCRKAQLINYDSHRGMFEAWNSNLWNSTSGLLLWMSHPAWPSTNWQTYSWDYETFGSYFGCKKACEPVHVQLNADDDKVCVINTTGNALENASVYVSCYDLNGRLLDRKEMKHVSCMENSLTECLILDSDVSESVYLVRLELKDSKKKMVSVNDYFRNAGGCNDFKAFNETGQAKLRCKAVKGGYSITNTSGTVAIAVNLALFNELNGEQILPVHFSDNYFNLLPGETRTINIVYSADCPVRLLCCAYNL